MHPARVVVVVCAIALVALGLAWELWLAPLRPGGSLLALKVIPLALSLPALSRDRQRAYQWWSMAILLYLCEGLVRATSDHGRSASLAIVETVLAATAYAAILLRVRATRMQAARSAEPPLPGA